MNVAVIGASNKPDRYSYLAVKLLQEKGHRVFPVHQRIKDIDGLAVYASIRDIGEPIDTVTFYVSPDISQAIAGEILAKHPRRIIFNPGTENPDLAAQAERFGIETREECTLVMLRSGKF